MGAGNLSDPPEQDLPPCLIRIDRDGVWYHNGVEMIHREFIRLFFERMSVDGLGRYVIELNGERCRVEVEDTAYVVRRADCGQAEGRVGYGVLLNLSDDTSERLAPDTLRIGKDNVLYCTVKDGRFPARFTRAAYYQLANYIEEREEGFYLELNGRKYPISADPAQGAA
jgi:uncharacterized protein